MSTSFYDIFKNREDYFKWDNHIAQLQSVDLSNEEKVQVTSAISYLREILGEDFLEKTLNEGHPFWLYYLLNRAPWVWLSLLRFVNMLKSFEHLPNFENLIERIKSPNERNGFVEAHSVIEIAQKFEKAGFGVLIDVPVPVMDRQGNKHERTPDIKLTELESGGEIYVEVTQLGSSRRQILSQNCHRVLWDLLHDAMDCEEGSKVNYQNRAFYLPYSRLLRDLEEDELEELVIKLKEFIESVKTNKEFQEFCYKKGIFECAIAPPGQHSLVKEWARSRNIKENEFILEPTLVPVDGLRRLKGRINKELKQLPSDKPGIVAIDFGDLVTLRTFPMGMIILELEKEVRLHSQLLFAMILQRWGEGDRDDESEVYGEHLVFKKKRLDRVTEKSIIIKNPVNKRPVSESTYKRLIAALIEF